MSCLQWQQQCEKSCMVAPNHQRGKRQHRSSWTFSASSQWGRVVDVELKLRPRVYRRRVNAFWSQKEICDTFGGVRFNPLLALMSCSNLLQLLTTNYLLPGHKRQPSLQQWSVCFPSATRLDIWGAQGFDREKAKVDVITSICTVSVSELNEMIHLVLRATILVRSTKPWSESSSVTHSNGLSSRPTTSCLYREVEDLISAPFNCDRQFLHFISTSSIFVVEVRRHEEHNMD